MTVEDDSDEAVVVVAYSSLSASELARADVQIDAIFFQASSVQSFSNDEHRRAFRWLWLGRYLVEEPQHGLVAMLAGEVCGYLVGSLADPAHRAEFRELAYFQEFSAQTERYPAHLHINVDQMMRSRGVGGLLIEAFEAHARAGYAPGMHIVTGAGMRNVGFYERLGFREVARAPRKGSEVVMLAKRIAAVT
jgi:GNAT superfamily N-acetyltransferase